MPEDGSYHERIASDQRTVVVFRGDCHVRKREDLSLILAAPDLLEALEELYHLIDDAHDGERIFTLEMQMKAKAAIAKAKGKPSEA